MKNKRATLILFRLLLALGLGFSLFSCEKVTFNEHIAPIIHQNCTPCHRPGEAGPFDLISYKDCAKRSRMLAKVTSSRFMPPWPADPAYSHFVGEKILTDEQIRLIRKWSRQGASEGDLALAPVLPVFPTNSGLGKPDLVVKMVEPFVIKGDNEDDFLVIKIPYEIPNDTFVRAIEFIPGNRALVHHMNGHLIWWAPGKKANPNEGKYIEDSSYFMGREQIHRNLGLLNDDGSFAEGKPLISAYLPGVYTNLYPEGIGGFKLPKQGAIVINDMHYGPTPVEESDQSRFNLFFGGGPPKRPTMELQMGTLGISEIIPPLIVPPNEIKHFVTRAKVLGDISVLTVNPHMHQLGKSFLAYAIPPKGDTIPLIRIPVWDFRWQFFYTYPTMLHLPAGTIIEVKAVFDNTTDNPFNPFDPPRTISEKDGSMKSTDEMLQFIITFVPYQPGDESISLNVKKPDKF